MRNDFNRQEDARTPGGMCYLAVAHMRADRRDGKTIIVLDPYPPYKSVLSRGDERRA